MTVCLVVLWELVVADIAGTDSPVLDALLLGLVLRAAWQRRARTVVGIPLAVGIAVMLLADIGDTVSFGVPVLVWTVVVVTTALVALAFAQTLVLRQARAVPVGRDGRLHGQARVAHRVVHGAAPLGRRTRRYRRRVTPEGDDPGPPLHP